MKKQSLIKGALILVGAGIINRIIGFAYRIGVMRTVGPEGVGLYEMVFPLYTLALVIITAGIPIALAKTVAELEAKRHFKSIYKLMFFSLCFMTFTSVLAIIIIVVLRPVLLPKLLPDPRSIFPFMTMVPALILVALSSILRGYFQGLQQMTPSAVSQICEQVVRTTLGITLAYKLLPYGPAYAATGLAAGMVIGETVGLISLLVFYRFSSLRRKVESNPSTEENLHSLIRKIMTLSFPITSARIVTASIMSIQAILIPRRLQAAGLSVSESTTVFGEFTGIALSLISLPTLFSNSMAISLVPAISEGLAKGQSQAVQRRIQVALSATIITGLPWAILYFLLPREISQMIFGVNGAAQTLQLLAMGCVFLYIQQTTIGILQGLGRVDIALKHIVLGAILNLGLVYHLTGIESLSIRGTAIAYSATWFSVSMLNLYRLLELKQISLDIKEMVVAPVIGSVGMTIAIILTWWQLQQSFFPPAICTLVSIVGGLAIYFGLVYFNSDTLRSYAKIRKL